MRIKGRSSSKLPAGLPFQAVADDATDGLERLVLTHLFPIREAATAWRRLLPPLRGFAFLNSQSTLHSTASQQDAENF
jgi:hypothetical protein